MINKVTTDIADVYVHRQVWCLHFAHTVN